MLGAQFHFRVSLCADDAKFTNSSFFQSAAEVASTIL